MSEQVLFDGIWRHIAWVDDNGSVQVYIDGELDEADLSYTRGTMTINTTAIGALIRGGPAVHCGEKNRSGKCLIFQPVRP